MTEETETPVLTGAADTDSSVLLAVVTQETSLCEVFENTLEISQDVGLTEGAASVDTHNKEKLEQEDGQRDGQTVSPPAAEPSSPQSKWVVGAACQAVWSEDGQVYLAKIVSVDGERCKVRFSGYGNEEEVELSALKSPDAVRQTQRQNCQDWRSGSRCRAVFTEDGLVYPAVVLWVKGQRCRVRFDDYNNEEEQDISDLLHPDELHGPSRTAAAAKGSSWRSSLTSNSSTCDWKRRRREENQGDRGAERRTAWRDEQHNSSSSSSSSMKDKSGHHSKVEKESEEKKKSTNHCSPFFPPFPPPQSSSGDAMSFIPPLPPPPPPLWLFGGKDVDASSSMLMLWYLCGFHTGSYLVSHMTSALNPHKDKLSEGRENQPVGV